jgi:ABC-type amino acid transport substrate-binding protein
VSGSDRSESPNLAWLRRCGLEVHVGHDPANVEQSDLVVRTSAVGTENVEIARALCEEIRVVCHFDVATQHELLDRLLQGKADMAASSVFEAPEQRGKLLQANPYYRSLSLWLGGQDVPPGRSGLRVAVVHGSIQEDYARRQGWEVRAVRSSGELARSLVAGESQAALVPMIVALHMQKSEAFRRLGLAPTVLRAPELGDDVSFGISPLRSTCLE